MVEEQGRPSRLSGLWTFVVGGALLVVLMWYLDPITRQEDCPNYGASGNASAFSNPLWDLYLPLVLCGWVILISAEQALPVTWRNRDRLNGAVRAAAAIVLSSSCSCSCLFLMIVCR